MVFPPVIKVTLYVAPSTTHRPLPAPTYTLFVVLFTATPNMAVPGFGIGTTAIGSWNDGLAGLMSNTASDGWELTPLIKPGTVYDAYRRPCGMSMSNAARLPAVRMLPTIVFVAVLKAVMNWF